MAKILIVEDDKIIAQGLKRAMEMEGHSVIAAHDGYDGLYMAKNENPDLLILDIMMPEMNGFEIITELRRTSSPVPIIVVSARTESTDRVKGLDLGADDYICKPFDLNELLARVRRFIDKNKKRVQIFEPFEYNWETQQLSNKTGKIILLSTKERKVLEFFLNRPNRIVSREMLLGGAWGSEYEGTDRTVDNIIVSLRKKLGFKYLISERGVGYRFVINNNSTTKKQ